MPSPEARDALSRTAQLLRLDVFTSTPSHDADIVTGLRSTIIRLVADRRAATSAGGQTAITTLYSQLAMTGLLVDLDIPDVELRTPQPPLHGDRLVAGLLGLGADLVPGGTTAPSVRPHLVIAMGDSHAPGADVRLTWTDDRAMSVPEGQTAPSADGELLPFGAIAAGAMGAAEGVRAAVPVIAAALDVPAPERRAWQRPGSRRMSADLAALVAGLDPRVGTVDAISAGAITTACLYTLLRVPGLMGRLRVLDDDRLDISNLNRYPLARLSLVGQNKVAVLASYAHPDFEITGEILRFGMANLGQLQPLANKVIVGVDVIHDRWTIQECYLDATVHVGATSHDFVLVTDHQPGTPCAGCTHPVDDEAPGPIPTIGFVSLWAGLIQATRLLARPRNGGMVVEVWSLGLDNRRGIRRYSPGEHPQCPVRCAASRRVTARSPAPSPRAN